MADHPRTREQAGQEANAQVGQGMAVEVAYDNPCPGPRCPVLHEHGNFWISKVMQEGGAKNKVTAALFQKRLLCIALNDGDFWTVSGVVLSDLADRRTQING
jgi:hypothetical protein